ncbi:hypothetical protein ALC56_03181, partial [Trachymyrmex septentrionalis]
ITRRETSHGEHPNTSFDQIVEGLSQSHAQGDPQYNVIEKRGYENAAMKTDQAFVSDSRTQGWHCRGRVAEGLRREGSRRRGRLSVYRLSCWRGVLSSVVSVPEPTGLEKKKNEKTNINRASDYLIVPGRTSSKSSKSNAAWFVGVFLTNFHLLPFLLHVYLHPSWNCQRQRKLSQPLMVFERGRSDAKDERIHAGQITILPLSRQTAEDIPATPLHAGDEPSYPSEASGQ